MQHGPPRQALYQTSPVGRWPDFFIVGAPKSGTTALWQFLRAHPDVFMPSLKEPHFFGRDLRDVRRAPRDPTRYLRLFQDAPPTVLMGEASTSYLQSESAPHEIKRVSPSAKIIIVLRHPVDVMYAFHGEHVLAGFEFLQEFEEALRAEPMRRRGQLLPHRSGILDGLFYREVVNYPDHVQRYLEVFGAGSVCILPFERLVSDPAAFGREILTFLGIDPAKAAEFGVANPSRRVRFPGLHSFLASPPRIVERAGHYLIPRRLHGRLGRALLRRNTELEKRPPLNRALRARLLELERERIERLGRLVGWDVPWCAEAATASESRPKHEPRAAPRNRAAGRG